MEELLIEGTKKTPEIRASRKGSLQIIGRSIPEDPTKFYEPLTRWIEDYSKNPAPQTEVCVQLEYFNSGTSKILLTLLRQLVELKPRSDVKIKWCYESGDDDIFERGDYFASLLETDFEFIEITQ
ncbi:MAG: DUF1987 domain-containing protein [Bacteroidales bacterium]|nr:DUF1987 domain-containing protein [Bacteroidales bacterium]